jgi:hypothetical protein
MPKATEFAVTLTPALFARLSEEARRLDVPLEWLAASLVVDTFQPVTPAPAASKISSIKDAA